MADGWRSCHKAGPGVQANQPPTVKEDKEAKAKVLQAMAGEPGATNPFVDYMRESIRGALWALMREEVETLCGTSHHPVEGALYRRAGSDDGILYFEGRKEAIKRPRVRERQADGSEREVLLETYAAARQQKNIEAQVMAFMEEGLSTRSAERMSGQAMSASEISRRFIAHSAGRVEQLRSRDLSGDEYLGLMIDGVFLTHELVVVVALAIRKDGTKQVLDFGAGSTESYEVVRALLSRLVERKFHVSGRLYAVLDGAKALHKAVVEFWPDAIIQDCVIHKERNLYAYLRKDDHEECARLMKRLRLAQGAVAAKEALLELSKFLKARNAQALLSLEEAGERLIALQMLDVPATLNVSLLSTNLIENAIHNYRRQTRRVTRWNPASNQVDRWSATALLWVERGFRKIKGHEDLGALISALKRP